MSYYFLSLKFMSVWISWSCASACWCSVAVSTDEVFFLFLVLQVKSLGETHPFTKLVVDLTDVDPDVAYCPVPYEKGFALLFYLEQLLGGPGEQSAFSDSCFWRSWQEIRKNSKLFMLLLRTASDHEILNCTAWLTKKKKKNSLVMLKWR